MFFLQITFILATITCSWLISTDKKFSQARHPKTFNIFPCRTEYLKTLTLYVINGINLIQTLVAPNSRSFSSYYIFRNAFSRFIRPAEMKIFNVNPLSANSTKWSNTLKQYVGNMLHIVWVCLTVLWGWHLKISAQKYSGPVI